MRLSPALEILTDLPPNIDEECLTFDLVNSSESYNAVMDQRNRMRESMPKQKNPTAGPPGSGVSSTTKLFKRDNAYYLHTTFWDLFEIFSESNHNGLCVWLRSLSEKDVVYLYLSDSIWVGRWIIFFVTFLNTLMVSKAKIIYNADYYDDMVIPYFILACDEFVMDKFTVLSFENLIEKEGASQFATINRVFLDKLLRRGISRKILTKEEVKLIQDYTPVVLDYETLKSRLG